MLETPEYKKLFKKIGVPLVLAGIPFVGFGLAFFLQKGYYRYFNVQSTFIRLSNETIANSVVLSFLLFLILILSFRAIYVSFFHFVPKKYRDFFSNFSLRFLILGVFLGFILNILNFNITVKVALFYLLLIILAFRIPSVFYFFLFLTMEIRGKKAFNIIGEKFIKKKYPIYKEKEINQKIINFFSGFKPYIIIFLVVSGLLALSAQIGYLRASTQKEFNIVKVEHKKCVVLDTIDQKLLCVVLNNNDNTLTSEIRLISIKEDTVINFVKLGKLKRWKP